MAEPVIVFVEVPSGSRNKYELDHDLGAIVLDRRLFTSMAYPADYGFIEGTMGGDGDPLDALVLVGEPTFPGCRIRGRIVGVFHMADEKGPDEKIICVPLRDPAWMRISDVHDIPAELRNEIEHFFQVYKDLEEAKVETHGYGNRVDAERVVAEARAREPPPDVEGRRTRAANRPSMAARRKKRPLRPRVPSRVKKRTRRPRSQHENELLGLALLALGLVLAAILYLGLDGGAVGSWLADVLTDVVGNAAYVLPVALVALGGLLLARSDLLDVRPFRLGVGVELPRPHDAARQGLRRLDRDGDRRNARSAHRTTGRGDHRRSASSRRAPARDRRLDRRDPSTHRPRDAARRDRVRSARSSGRRASRRRQRTSRTPGRRRSPCSTGCSTAQRRIPTWSDRRFARRRARSFPRTSSPSSRASSRCSRRRPSTRSTGCRIATCSARRRRPPTTKSDASAKTADLLVRTLSEFGVEATVMGQISGPRVTRYELQLAPGTKVSKVAGLKDDLSYALATTEIRILAPIPGKQAVGVEVPNLSPKLVTLGDIFGDLPATASPLSVWLGKDISGNAIWTDLARMPHLLIAGTTGSGKSGCINTILTSTLLRSTPDEVRMILIDPKRIELGYYESIPHLLTPVVSNPKEAAVVLMNVVAEMERRYERLSFVRARSLPEANRAFRARGEDPLPYLLVVIDELADLMMVSPQAVEDCVIRLAQKSRAVGIHLVLATQRPSVDVITGMIKANVPSRIAFAVSSQTDSRVILDGAGAESLLGQGDMLFKPLGTSRLQRLQGAYVSEEEVALVVEQCRSQRGQDLDESLLEAPEAAYEESDEDGEFDPDEDPLLDKAIEIVVQTQTASVSLLQRRLRVGYTRAGRLVDMLERRGIISGYEGSKPRRVLVSEADLHTV